MEVFDAVRTVLAVREYQDRPLSAELIRRIMDSAHLTGSSRNGQPWHFIAVQKRETLQALGELARTGPYIAQAQFAVVVLMEESPYDISDGSRAIQSMMLTAWSEGVGSNWVGFASLEQLRPLLAVPPALRALAVISFGYPTRRLGLGKKKRRPFDEVISSERFGQPFA